MTIDEIIERRFRRDMSPPFDPTAWFVVAAKDAVRGALELVAEHLDARANGLEVMDSKGREKAVCAELRYQAIRIRALAATVKKS